MASRIRGEASTRSLVSSSSCKVSQSQRLSSSSRYFLLASPTTPPRCSTSCVRPANSCGSGLVRWAMTEECGCSFGTASGSWLLHIHRNPSSPSQFTLRLLIISAARVPRSGSICRRPPVTHPKLSCCMHCGILSGRARSPTTRSHPFESRAKRSGRLRRGSLVAAHK